MLHPLNNTTDTVFIDLIAYRPSARENKETTLLIRNPNQSKNLKYYWCWVNFWIRIQTSLNDQMHVLSILLFIVFHLLLNHSHLKQYWLTMGLNKTVFSLYLMFVIIKSISSSFIYHPTKWNPGGKYSMLEKAEEPEIKLPKSAGSSKKQENSRKTSISALLTSQSLWLCRSQQTLGNA